MMFRWFVPWLGTACARGYNGAWFVTTLWWLRPVLSFVLFLIAVYVIYRIFFAKSNFFRRKDQAIEILNERFAKGEITDEEYKRMRNILEEHK
ncbi:SHOCT domain-containing protein [Fervidobacterium sp.]